MKNAPSTDRTKMELRGDFSWIDAHILESRIKAIAVIAFLVYWWYLFG